MNKPRYYWDVVPGPYQHGPQKHRLYMMDMLKKRGVTEILDVGCGTGPLYEIIQETMDPDIKEPTYKYDQIEYKGTDYSEHFIEVAHQLFPDADFELQDMRHLKEADNSWDAVVMLHSLDHVKQYDQAIAEAARVAKRYVCIVLWRQFAGEGVNINDRNMMDKKEGEEPWEDTYLVQYSQSALETEFKKNHLIIDETVEGDVINSDHSKWNFIYMLRKEPVWNLAQ